MSRRFFLIAFLIPSLALSVRAEDKPRVSEGLFELTVKAWAPLLTEITNETQAAALARESAIAQGQMAILGYVLDKKSHSHKTLAEAEIPSLPLQGRIRGMVKGARVT